MGKRADARLVPPTLPTSMLWRPYLCPVFTLFSQHFHWTAVQEGRRESSVSIVTGVWADSSGWNISLCHGIHTTTGAHPASYLIDTRVSLAGTILARCADNSSPSTNMFSLYVYLLLLQSGSCNRQHCIFVWSSWFGSKHTQVGWWKHCCPSQASLH